MSRFSIESKSGDLMKDPKAVAILEEYWPGLSKDMRMKLVSGMSLKALCAFPQAAGFKEHLPEIDARLQAIE